MKATKIFIVASLLLSCAYKLDSKLAINYSSNEQQLICYLEGDSLPTNVKRFLINDDYSIVKYAVEHQTIDKIPASVTIAQAALETGWGKYSIENNFFGMKGKGTSKTTREVYNKKQFRANNKKIISYKKVGDKYDCQIIDDFKTFENLKASFEYRVKLINSKYRECIGLDYKQFCDCIHKKGYATDPTYAKKLKEIIKKYKLHLLDKVIL